MYGPAPSGNISSATTAGFIMYIISTVKYSRSKVSGIEYKSFLREKNNNTNL